MKKKNKESSEEKTSAIHDEFEKGGKKLNEGGINSNYPEEYEEQVSPDIRMKPQPFVKPKKKAAKG